DHLGATPSQLAAQIARGPADVQNSLGRATEPQQALVGREGVGAEGNVGHRAEDTVSPFDSVDPSAQTSMTSESGLGSSQRDGATPLKTKRPPPPGRRS